MSDQLSLNEAISRWLKWNNGPLGPNEDNYDFELDMQLSKADGGFLIDLLEALAKVELSTQAIATLGAGLAEELLIKHNDCIEELQKRIEHEPRIKEIFTYSWDREDMGPQAIEFLRNLQHIND